jgi:hypothetical protein
MEKSTLGRAMRFFQESGVDHLAALPEVLTPGKILPMFMGGFFVFFCLFIRPWRVRNPKSSAHIGVGAFNLIRTQTYQALGTHKAIAMRPDDDLKLGKLVKKHGFRQEALTAKDLISVEWYPSIRELVRGLMKNSFAGMEYSLTLMVASTVVTLALFVWPWIGMIVTDGATQWINTTSVLLTLGFYWDTSRFSGARAWHALGFPLVSLFIIYIMWRASLLTLFNDGINWRGTHYSLAELKANKV